MRVGKFIVPTYRLKRIMPKIISTYHNHKGTSMTKQQLADGMNLQVESGGFNQIISDCKVYGLLEGGINGYNITQLGQDIIQTPDTKKVEQLIRNVDLWDIWFEKYSFNITDRIVLHDLIQLAGLDENSAKKRVKEIFDAYINDIDYVKQYRPIPIPPQIQIEVLTQNQDSSQSPVTLQPPISLKENVQSVFVIPVRGYRITSEYGGFQIEVKDEETFNLALQLLNAIRRELKKQNVKFSNDEKEVHPMGS